MVYSFTEMDVPANNHENRQSRQSLRQPENIAPGETVPGSSGMKENLVTFQTGDGLELQGTPVRVTRHVVTFELYNPAAVPRLSEVLDALNIVLQGRRIYFGRAVVRNVVSEGLNLICEAGLDEVNWLDMDFELLSRRDGHFAQAFKSFLGEWQKFYQVLPTYKIIVADMQTFFTELRLWLEQVELGVRSAPSGSRMQLEQEVTAELAEVIIPSINELFEKFESVAEGIEPDQRAAHASYFRQHLHPLVLGAPFAHRAFYKPLGFAGDYEMVNMIARNGLEGGSLFAKVVNCCRRPWRTATGWIT